MTVLLHPITETSAGISLKSFSLILLSRIILHLLTIFLHWNNKQDLCCKYIRYINKYVELWNCFERLHLFICMVGGCFHGTFDMFVCYRSSQLLDCYWCVLPIYKKSQVNRSGIVAVKIIFYEMEYGKWKMVKESLRATGKAGQNGVMELFTLPRPSAAGPKCDDSDSYNYRSPHYRNATKRTLYPRK